jgi:putative addiction module CopG family antidote
MDITLSPEAEKLVRERLESGEYQNASEVLEDALRALEVWRAGDYEEAVQGIRRGLESAGRGEGRPAQEFFDEMRQKHGIPR